jgi:DNA-binding NtrC family response regulator
MKILVVDDEKNMREMIRDVLQHDGHRVFLAASGEEALVLAKETGPDVILLDLKLPGIDGIETFRRLKKQELTMPVIMITAHGTVERAVSAIKEGIFDFIIKPFDIAKLKNTLLKSQEMLDFIATTNFSRPSCPATANQNIIGESPQIRSVLDIVAKVADTDATVLIQGESGTGKELVALALHHMGQRKNQPFVSINCAALPETLLEAELFGFEKGAFSGAIAQKIGKIELAEAGTLFLDEVGDMPLAMQAKVLRVLQEKNFSRIGGNKNIVANIRIIAATNKNLPAAMSTGNFRPDLYYRLNVIPIFLPPLRDRPVDIPQLIEHFLKKYANHYRKEIPPLSTAQLANLLRYPWPGNIRELKNTLEKIVLLGPITLPESGPEEARSLQGERIFSKQNPITVPSLKEGTELAQRNLIIQALKIAKGNKVEAAKLLKISYKTLFNKIHELNVQIQLDFE